MDASYDVQLIVPAQPGSARLARLVATGVAADASFTLDDTEDLRVAVSELVALLVEGAEDPNGEISLSYRSGEGEVEVSGQRTLTGTSAAANGPAPDDLALEILQVVVDQHHYGHDQNGRHFHLVKRARTGV